MTRRTDKKGERELEDDNKDGDDRTWREKVKNSPKLSPPSPTPVRTRRILFTILSPVTAAYLSIFVLPALNTTRVMSHSPSTPSSPHSFQVNHSTILFDSPSMISRLLTIIIFVHRNLRSGVIVDQPTIDMSALRLTKPPNESGVV